MNNYSAELIIYQPLPYLQCVWAAAAPVDRDAEEGLMTDNAKISVKSPLSREMGGGQHQKGTAQSAYALKRCLFTACFQSAIRNVAKQ